MLECTPGKWVKDEMDLVTSFTPARICSFKACTSLGNSLGSNENGSRSSSVTFQGEKCQGRNGNKKVSSCIWENFGKEKKVDHSHMRTKSLISQGCPNPGLNIIFCYYCFIHLLFLVLSGIGVICKFQRVIWLPSQSPLIFLPHIWHYTVRKNSQYPFPKLRHFIQWPHHLEHWKTYFLETD